MKGQISKAELAEAIGEFIQYWGFKSIHGRIWALVYVSDRPISTPQIVETLCVSKGLVSLAIKELLEFGLIQEEEKGEFGALTYSAKEDVARVVRGVLRERELKILSDVESKISCLKSHSENELNQQNISIPRLQLLEDLTVQNRRLLTSVISKRFDSISDWIRFIKKAANFLRL